MNQDSLYHAGEQLKRPGYSLLLGFGLLFICLLFSNVLAASVLQVLFDDSGLDGLLSQRGGRTVYRLVMGLANLITWGLAAVLWAVYTGGFRRQIRLEAVSAKGLYPLAMVMVVAALPLVNFLLISSDSFDLPAELDGMEQWMRDSEKRSSSIMFSLLGDSSLWGLAMNVLVIAVVPAVAEELFFRGFLVGTLQKLTRNPHWAVWIGAAIFSAIHFQFFGFFSRLLLGALLGYLYVWSGSLWPSILAHFTHNLLSLLIAVGSLRGWLPASFLDDNFHFNGWLVVASMGLTIGVLLIYWRLSRDTAPKQVV